MKRKRNQYWWIKRKNGKLEEFGRERYDDGQLVSTGCPNLFPSKEWCVGYCVAGETPVTVEITEVKQLNK